MISSDVLKKLLQAEKVTVLTGAGVSAESGVKTFRGEDGFWKNNREQDLATVSAFEKNPSLVSDWYNYRRSMIKKADPNPGHIAIARLEKIYKDNFHLITQNVDGLHKRAGSKNILELHGNIWQTRCTSCLDIADFDENQGSEVLPKCKLCNSLLRPDIVWFGELLDNNILQASIDAARNSDLFFVVGTSSYVQPAASLSLIAKEANAFVIEINTESTPITSYVDLSIKGESGKILPEIVFKIEAAIYDRK